MLRGHRGPPLDTTQYTNTYHTENPKPTCVYWAFPLESMPKVYHTSIKIAHVVRVYVSCLLVRQQFSAVRNRGPPGHYYTHHITHIPKHIFTPNVEHPKNLQSALITRYRGQPKMCEVCDARLLCVCCVRWFCWALSGVEFMLLRVRIG